MTEELETIPPPVAPAPLRKQYASEVLATFFLVFVGCGAVAVNHVHPGSVTSVGISLAFGLVVTVMIYTVGEVSGAHINPAVTIAFWAARRFPGGKVVPYILCQCVGALAASGVLKFLFPQAGSIGETLPAGSVWQSFVLEVLLTFLLMWVILCVSIGAKEKGITAGLVIGAVIAFEAMFGGPVSGASMNPARSLGPAVVSGNLQHLWIYLVAPVVGAVASILACCCVQEEGCCRSADQAC